MHLILSVLSTAAGFQVPKRLFETGDSVERILASSQSALDISDAYDIPTFSSAFSQFLRRFCHKQLFADCAAAGAVQSDFGVKLASRRTIA